MSKIPVLIDQLRGVLLNNNTLVGLGFTKQNVYRRYSSKQKEETAKYPVITISYDANSREIFAAIDNFQMFFEVRLKDYDDALAVIDLVGDILHLYAFSGLQDPNNPCTYITIYKCWLQGGPPAPIFDEAKNAWGATLEFSLAVA